MAGTSRGVEQAGKVADRLCKQGQLQPPRRQAGRQAAVQPLLHRVRNYTAVTHGEHQPQVAQPPSPRPLLKLSAALWEEGY